MRDKDDETRIKAYMEAKMTHIKMYNECMNLADGLDVEKFAELVRADERQACLKLCDKIEAEAYQMYRKKRDPYEDGVSAGARACMEEIARRK
jgi:hypothetical protein